MSVVLGYWNIRGLAQSIRLLLKYTGTEFEDIRYNERDGPEPYEEWQSVKETLGLEFPNLPYLIDGDTKLTQSNAILKYIGRKNNLGGKNETDLALLDMLQCTAYDFRVGFARVVYNPDMESMKEDYLKKIKTFLKRISDFLGDKPWFIGEEISYVDFQFYDALDIHRMFEPTIFDDYPTIKAFMDRFEALPSIKEYMASSEFLANPVNMKKAKWGGN